MVKLIRTRELLSRYPWLDAVRMKFLAWVCSDGIGFFDRSYRTLKVMSPGAAKLLKDPQRKPVTFAIYHGRMSGALEIKPRARLNILISNSRDGEMIARGCLAMGFSVSRGSPTLGAVKGALNLIDAAQQGQDLAFMVDGPRGPRYAIKPGIVRMAELAGTPIVPFMACARQAFWSPSWDSFMAPGWATPIVYLFGDPIDVPAGAGEGDRQEILELLQARMEHLRETADKIWQAV